MSPKPETDLAGLVAIAEPILKKLIVDPIVAAIASSRPAEKKRPLCTLDEAAEILGVLPATVKRLRKEGKLVAIRSGPHWMFSRAAVEDFKL